MKPSLKYAGNQSLGDLIDSTSLNVKTLEFIEGRLKEVLGNEYIYIDVEQAFADYLGSMVKVVSTGRNYGRITLNPEDIGLPKTSVRAGNINLPSMNLLPVETKNALVNAMERARHNLIEFGIERGGFYWVPLKNWDGCLAAFNKEQLEISLVVSDMLDHYEIIFDEKMVSARSHAAESYDTLLAEGVEIVLPKEEDGSEEVPPREAFIALFVNKIRGAFPSREKMNGIGIELQTTRPTPPRILDLIARFQKEFEERERDSRKAQITELDHLLKKTGAEKPKSDQRERRSRDREERQARERMLAQRTEIWLKHFEMSSLLDDIAEQAGAELVALCYALAQREIRLDAPTSRKLKNMLTRWFSGPAQMVGDAQMSTHGSKLMAYLAKPSRDRDPEAIAPLADALVKAMARVGRKRPIFHSAIGKNIVRI